MLTSKEKWCRRPPKAEAAAKRDWVIAQRQAGRTLNDIGKELGVTRERVRQIEKKYYDVAGKSLPPLNKRRKWRGHETN